MRELSFTRADGAPCKLTDHTLRDLFFYLILSVGTRAL